MTCAKMQSVNGKKVKIMRFQLQAREKVDFDDGR